MKHLKKLAIFLLIYGKVVLASNQLEGVYNLHLYFGDSKPFEDLLILTVGENNELKGQMHVPNDFDANIEGVAVKSANGITRLSFYIALPEKYHKTFGRRLFYELHFLPRSPLTIKYDDQFVGFVTHHKTEYRPTYVGSLAGFKKKN